MSRLALQLKRHDRQIQGAIVPLVLAIVVWAAHFYYYQQFSLYYEDYSRIPTAMQWEWSQIWEFWAEIPEAIIEAEYEGRPLHPGFIRLLARLGEQIGGLPAIYLLAYALNLLNVLLFHKLIQRSSDRPFFALTSALGFALFSANQNHAFLTSALGIMPALTFLLIAFHFYLIDRRNSTISAYFAIFVSLFCYEKFLPLFWAAPLLKTNWKWNARSRRELVRHTFILGLMLFAAALIRKLNGEGRVTSLDSNDLDRVTTAIGLGPAIALLNFGQRSIQALTHLKGEWLVPLILLFVAIAYCLHHAQLFRFKEIGQTEQRSNRSDTTLQMLIRWSAIGYITLALGYVLTLSGQDSNAIYQIAGRQSLVHVAAVFGAAILCGCCCNGIHFLASRVQKKLFSTVGLSLFFTLLIAAGLNLQQHQVALGQLQRSFWTQVSRLCPDMTENTIILTEFDRSNLALTDSFGGQFVRTLGYIYKFPDEWTNERDFRRATQPKIYMVQEGWQNRATLSANNLIQITKRETFRTRDFQPQFLSSNTILLSSEKNTLTRQTELTIRGKTLPLKQNDRSVEMPPYRSNVLFDDLIIP